MERKVCAIVAMDEARVIGRSNALPWRIAEDMQRFSALTKGQIVLMGRKTYESLPEKFRPLPGRRNLVLSRSGDSIPGAELWQSPEACIAAFRRGEMSGPESVLWVIGGEQVYRQTIGDWDELYLTLVSGSHAGDAYFPEFETEFELAEVEPRPGYSFRRYRRRSR